MSFARRVFLIAGVWGVSIVFPLYFLEGRIGRDQPPPITHPEFYYGFVGVTLVFQILFLVIASDPVRYRPIMLVSILEKVSYGFATPILYGPLRVPAVVFPGSLTDLVGAVFFAIA